jgi:antitoxin component YwqK of YwqJK toxin-antitoxin module
MILISCSANRNEKIIYYDDGNIKEKFIFVDKKDTSTYAHYLYFENAQLKHVYQKINGKLNGAEIAYYPNGQVNYEINYLNDMANGTTIVFTEKGEIELIKTYKDDKLNGQYISYRNRLCLLKDIYASNVQIKKVQFDIYGLLQPGLHAQLL